MRRSCTSPPRSRPPAGSSPALRLHDALVTAIAVLIITCPCALALAIPAVQVVASGALFRAGVILNAGDAIERLAEADTVVFDKTGTLTLPEPRVVNAAAIDPALLQMAARLALSSRHPLAMALAREAASAQPYDDAIEEPGQGVRAVIGGDEARLGSPAFCGLGNVTALPGSSLIVFSHAGKTAAIAIAQKLRPDAVEVMNVLRGLGLDLRILSGDRDEVVAPVARELGITHWQGGLTPAEKIVFIDALKAERPPRADGRRRAQRRARARFCLCFAVANFRRRPDAGAGRRRLPRRHASSPCRTPSSSPAAPAG